MRAIPVAALGLLSAFGCGNSALMSSGPPQADGGRFCPQPVGDCTQLRASATTISPEWCTFSAGFASACRSCVGQCSLVTGIAFGVKYTYLSIVNVDLRTVVVYDATGALVAVLDLNRNDTRCVAGPPDFDPTEAMALTFTTASYEALRQMCATSDGGADGAAPDTSGTG